MPVPEPALTPVTNTATFQGKIPLSFYTDSKLCALVCPGKWKPLLHIFPMKQKMALKSKIVGFVVISGAITMDSSFAAMSCHFINSQNILKM